MKQIKQTNKPIKINKTSSKTSRQCFNSNGCTFIFSKNEWVCNCYKVEHKLKSKK